MSISIVYDHDPQGDSMRDMSLGTITSGGQLSIPARIRRRWGTRQRGARRSRRPPGGKAASRRSGRPRCGGSGRGKGSRRRSSARSPAGTRQPPSRGGGDPARRLRAGGSPARRGRRRRGGEARSRTRDCAATLVNVSECVDVSCRLYGRAVRGRSRRVSADWRCPACFFSSRPTEEAAFRAGDLRQTHYAKASVRDLARRLLS